jgi:hypothetical protein
VRWRLADAGPHQPLIGRGDHWSFDGERWYPTPLDVTAKVSAEAIPRISDAVRDDVQAYLDDGIDEPLAHTLWREAWGLRGANPRSALLIGMAALEVGIKHYISGVVPETRWLLEELPAPPIHRLLNEYIPELPTPSGLEPTALSPGVRDTVRDAQGLRNKVAHAGRAAARPDSVERTLETVRGILSRLDLYRGFAWASNPRDE